LLTSVVGDGTACCVCMLTFSVDTLIHLSFPFICRFCFVFFYSKRCRVLSVGRQFGCECIASGIVDFNN